MQPFDLQRMFIGDAPLGFLLEIVVRTVILYLYLLTLMRLIGRRGMQEISIFDFLIVIALGSAVGDPMFYPDVPIVHGLVVITVIVLLEWGLGLITQKNVVLESAIEGQTEQVVGNGQINPEFLRHSAVSPGEIFMQIRKAGARHLGQVEAAYHEIDGKYSVFLYPPGEERPGLLIVPPWDIAPPEAYERGMPAPHSTTYACLRCGTITAYEAGQTLPECSRCGGDRWTRAVMPIPDPRNTTT